MTHPTLDIHADITQASTLPGWCYTDSGFYEQCRERIFSRSWQIVGSAEDVRTPGQVSPVSFLPGCLDEPILLTRDDKDKLHCLSNACTHRGGLVCETPGKAASLRCPYHGRRFTLDGRFQSMPEFEQTEDFPTGKDDLPRLELETFGPFLFAALDPAYSFDELISPIRDRVGWLPLEEFVYDPSRSRDYLVKANWALYCDNYLEGFHIPFVHAALNAELEYGQYTTELYPYCNLQLGISRGSEMVFDLPECSPDHGRNIAAYYYWLFPNLMFNFYPWGLSLNIVRPLAPDRTKVSFQSWVWDKTKLASGAGAELDRVEREDEAIVEAVQKGVGSRLYDRGRYSPTREQGVHHFHRLVAKSVGQAL